MTDKHRVIQEEVQLARASGKENDPHAWTPPVMVQSKASGKDVILAAWDSTTPPVTMMKAAWEEESRTLFKSRTLKPARPPPAAGLEQTNARVQVTVSLGADNSKVIVDGPKVPTTPQRKCSANRLSESPTCGHTLCMFDH